MRPWVMEEESKPVQLEPFAHQVGGHCCMLKFDDKTVCKPLNSREYHFYQTMPEDLREFTPQYRGTVEVTFIEDDDGYITLLGYPQQGKKKAHKRALHPSSSPGSSGEGAQSDSDSDTPGCRTRQSYRLPRRHSADREDTKRRFEDVQASSSGLPSVPGATASQNPWSIRCHKGQLAKLRKSQNSGTQKFVLLEDIASRFHYPCILDLKMGTRQHGDDVSEAKRQSHMKRCASTTSASLGIRICGMQMYQVGSQHYICHNKYFGRQLTEEGVQESLYRFLHNGNGLRLEIVDPLIERLQHLKDLLAKQNTFRFYSSSLLLMYEGHEKKCDARWKSSMSREGKENTGKPHVSSDARDSDSDKSSRTARPMERQSSGSSHSSPERSRSRDKTRAGLPRSHDALSNGRLSQVDVRMIDFAHTTHQGFYGDKTVHTGPDQGYLFGLENLIQMLRDVQEGHS